MHALGNLRVAGAPYGWYNEVMISKFAPGLRESLMADQSAEVNLILRVQGDPAACRVQIERAGFRVRRAFRLVPAFAVTGPASAALALAEASWLTQVEPDHPVHIM